jgi:alpha-galactosidase
MLAHNVPRVDGAVPPPFLTASSSSQFDEMQAATEANQTLFVDRYLDHGVALDYWWMDAGWYATQSGRWPETGTWEVDTRRFPRGLRGVADHAHARGVKILVWFEPERVAAGTWLDREHPEWLLDAPGARSKLLDLGNPEALRWAIAHFDTLVTEQGVDLYRQDFNMPPLEHWRAADAAAGPHREGIAEIRHVCGYLAYWDELRRRHPGLLIDTCASGGRRNDLETLRRSVPLHVTDHDYADYTARQNLAYGLALWVPLYGTMVCKRDAVDVYAVRSAVGTRLGLGFDVRLPDLDWPLLQRLVDEWRRTAPLLYGDFYPLTSYSTDHRDWIAFQHDRPEHGDGVVHVFRRAASPYVAARFPLRGLDAEVTYSLIDPVRQVQTEMTGGRLMGEGLPVTLAEQPAAALFTYTRRRV